MEARKLQKGFTLIELLVVIAIVAVLATVVILTLNPAELLRQARDSNRISDAASLNSALSLYLADVATISLGTSANCYISVSSATSPANCGFASGLTYTMNATTGRAVNGTGWVPVNLSAIGSGAPIGQLPIDPKNSDPYYYRYVPSTTQSTFKLGVKMESTKYKSGGSDDVESKDGGTSSTLYEIGSNLSL